MISLRTPTTAAPSRQVLCFGQGCVGSAIVEALPTAGFEQQAHHPIAWQDLDRTHDSLRSIQPKGDEGDQLHVVWAAGRAGFAASQAECDAERQSFDAVMAWTRELRHRWAGPHHLHLVSSAGGLFEGQRLVDHMTPPNPIRPYGRLKLELERRLFNDGDWTARHIYRLPSVYGFLMPGARAGLISALLLCAMKRQEARLYGSLTALRDYVFSLDVGHYITHTVTAPTQPREPQTHTLVSARPTPFPLILEYIRRITRQRVYLRAELTDTNAADITFANSLRPKRFQPIDLESGIRRVWLRHLQTSGS